MGGKNRIVVDYGDMEDLILLGAFNTDTGEEVRYNQLVEKHGKDFQIVKRFNEYNVDELLDLNINNFEGFVVRFESGFRLKAKLDEYVRLHRIVTNVSTRTVWEMLKDEKDIESMISNVPDEFYEWFKKTVDTLNRLYTEIELDALREFKSIIAELCDNNLPQKFFNKKEFALKAKKSKYAGLLFSMFEGKDYSRGIWMMIKPKASSPFKGEFQ